MRFEWDSEKAVTNLARHGVPFNEAVTVFHDPLATTVHDPDHSQGEDRWLTTGMSSQLRLVIVWHADREEDGEEVVRIIGARRATPNERRTYESGE